MHVLIGVNDDLRADIASLSLKVVDIEDSRTAMAGSVAALRLAAIKDSRAATTAST